MARGRTLARLGGIALAFALGATPAAAQEDPVGTQASALFAQARPHLEEVLGVKIDRPPQFRGATAEQLQKRADAELYATVCWQFPHLQGEQLTRAYATARALAVTAAVVEHAEGAWVIDVLPDGHRQALAKWDESLAAAGSPDFLQLALVHEVVCCILEQRYQLVNRRRACADGEELHALQAITEGRAQWATVRVAQRLGTEAAFLALANRYRYMPDIGPDGALRAISQKAVRQRYVAQVKGLEFFAGLDKVGVKDAEATAFAHPPKTLALVERPEAFVRGLQATRPDLPTALKALHDALPAPAWAAAQQPWTAAMVRQVAALVGDGPRAEKVTAGWDEGRTLVWTSKDNPGHQIGLSVVRCASAAAARSYFGFAGELQRKSEEKMVTCGMGFRVLEAKTASVEFPGVDEAVRNDKKLQLGTGAAPVAYTSLLVRAGDVVLECSWHGAPVDAAWAAGLVAAALKEVGR